jgi:hypothetical protein
MIIILLSVIKPEIEEIQEILEILEIQGDPGDPWRSSVQILMSWSSARAVEDPAGDNFWSLGALVQLHCTQCSSLHSSLVTLVPAGDSMERDHTWAAVCSQTIQ